MARLNITLDDELLNRINDYADENYMSRSGLISLACSQFLSSAEVSKAVVNLSIAMKKIADTGVVDDDTRAQLDYFDRFSKMIIPK